MNKVSFKIIALVVFLLFLSFGIGIGIGWWKTSVYSSNVTLKNSVASQDNILPKAVSEIPSSPSDSISGNTAPQNTTSAAPESAAISSDTAPQNGETSFSFAVIGDTKSFKAGNPNGNLEKAVKSLSGQNFAFDFVMGDLVQSCDGGAVCEQKYADWKNVMAPILQKTYEVQGNHDRTGRDAADAVWQKEFNLPTNGPSGYSKLTYSFDYGNSHFVVLTSERPQQGIINDVQRNWLDQDLTNNKKENIFVFWHEPAFQFSQDTKDALDAHPAERDAFWNVIVKHHVTAVFNGHLHMISRKKQDNVEQFVIGDTDSTADDVPQKGLTDWGLTGHHYAMISVNGKTVDVKIYSLDGQVENDYSFSN